jgi:lipopolysaccharide/colanic/teichoic acid biosynthesis glycosyltransferase
MALRSRPVQREWGTDTLSWRLRKRAFDLVVGTVLALVCTPLIVALAVVTAVSLRSWPFFVQERITEAGRHRRFYKLRTLPKHTPPYALKRSLELNLPRVPLLLRRLHLDELPQLYLVPLGRLSLVGPRPKMPDAFEPVHPTYGALRVMVPQGCTGLWQVGSHTDELPHETPDYDYFYLRYGCLRLDLWVLWRTARHMLGVNRPIVLDDVPSWVRGPGYVDRSMLDEVPEARLVSDDGFVDQPAEPRYALDGS